MGIFRIDKFELFFSIYFLWKRIAESGIKVDLDVTEIKEIEGIDNNGREDRVSFKRVSEFQKVRNYIFEYYMKIIEERGA